MIVTISTASSTPASAATWPPKSGARSIILDIGQQGWRTLEEQDDITALVGERPSCRFLDVACGSGGPSLATVPHTVTGSHLTGVDIEAAGIAEADDQAVAMGLTDSAKFLVANCSEPLPFDDSTFDVVVCIDAVPHFADRNRVFQGFRCRLLSPGGRLFLTDAAVLTGAVSRAELDVTASQGYFVFVPPGCNETSLSQAGFRLLSGTGGSARTQRPISPTGPSQFAGGGRKL